MRPEVKCLEEAADEFWCASDRGLSAKRSSRAHMREPHSGTEETLDEFVMLSVALCAGSLACDSFGGLWDD